jgi:hypothetical protein
MIHVLIAPFLPVSALSIPSQTAVAAPAAGAAIVDLACLVRLIEGRGRIADYTAFTEAIQEEGMLARFGMTKVEQTNPLLEEYRLKTPIRVFHRETSRICFGSAGVMAILEGVKAETLAKELNLSLFLQTPSKAMYSRAVRDQSLEPDETGLKMREIIRLNVSTVSSHPGCVLAGCEYRVEVQ